MTARSQARRVNKKNITEDRKEEKRKDDTLLIYFIDLIAQSRTSTKGLGQDRKPIARKGTRTNSRESEGREADGRSLTIYIFYI